MGALEGLAFLAAGVAAAAACLPLPHRLVQARVRLSVSKWVLEGRLVMFAGTMVLLVFSVTLLRFVGVASADEGTVTVTVIDSSGPVANAWVDLVTPSSDVGAETQSNGSATVSATAGVYTLTVAPPSGSPDTYYEQPNVTVSNGTTTDISATLNAGVAQPGSVSGSVTYANGEPAPGVHILFGPDPGNDSGPPDVVTDDSGNWTISSVAVGTYEVAADYFGSGSLVTEADQYITLGSGESQIVDLTLPADVGLGSLAASVSGAGLPAQYAAVTAQAPASSSILLGSTDETGQLAAQLPSGTYQLTIASDEEMDADTTTESVTIADGATTTSTFDLPALGIPSGITATSTAVDIALLNAERARWGIPGDVAANAIWSDACAAHDAYMHDNNVLQHPESQGTPGYSDGGNWAGTDAIMAEGSTWTANDNPWEDAPYHLTQLMEPDIVSAGIDQSFGYSCMTTWPGMRGPVAAEGTVYTYPGDGTTGLPPAENAEELPAVPGDSVGIPEGTIAGRELFVYEEAPPLGACGGDCTAPSAAPLTSAALTGPSGPVAIQVVDAGGYSPADIIIPVEPLAPDTTYTAAVTLGTAVDDGLVPVPSVSHTWSFTTGVSNPDGEWPTSNATTTPKPGRSTSSKPRRPTVSHARISGVAKRKPKLVFTLTAARDGTSLTKLSVALPAGFSLARSKTTLKGGLLLQDGSERAKWRAAIRGRTLVVTLSDRALSVRFSLSGPALSVTRTLAKKVRAHRTRTLSVAIEAFTGSAQTRFLEKLKVS
jgi:hypothetical protein